jgi:hypothetical protein
MKPLRLFGFLFLLALLLSFQPTAEAQTLTSATVVGVVTDTSGAIVAKANVKIVQTDTGSVHETTSTSSGEYRFPFLNPGDYEITAESGALDSAPVIIHLLVGQEKSVPLHLTVKSVQQTVQVTDNSDLLQSENANNVTSYDQHYIENTPVNGGDVTNIAFSTPGIRLNVGGGNTNFNVNGLPFSSVLFTVNGADIVEPYNLNNKSGTSNNTLGANDVAEAAVITNAYSAQYGREAGAQVNYVSKSGGNSFHGNLVENYNSQILNANDYFNKAVGTPRGRATANQYAASVGGPVIIPHVADLRDKVTFFVNTEGLRYALPTTGVVSVPYYQSLFKLYNAGPGIGRAIPVANGSGQLQDGTDNQGCGNKGFSGTPVPNGGGTTFGGTSGIPCALAFRTTALSQGECASRCCPDQSASTDSAWGRRSPGATAGVAGVRGRAQGGGQDV